MNSTKPPGSDSQGLRHDNPAAKQAVAAIVDAGADVSALLALSDERALWMSRLADETRDAYRRGYDDGQADKARRADRAWAAQRPQHVPAGPTLAELELLRWGPGGREHYGDPRPGDRFGRQGAAT